MTVSPLPDIQEEGTREMFLREIDVLLQNVKEFYKREFNKIGRGN